MNGPGDGARLLLTALLAGWAMAFAYSFHELAQIDFRTDLFRAADGLPPAIEFLRWQGVALLLAVAVFGVSLGWPRGAAVRGLGVLPLSLALLVGAGLAIAFALG